MVVHGFPEVVHPRLGCSGFLDVALDRIRFFVGLIYFLFVALRGIVLNIRFPNPMWSRNVLPHFLDGCQ